MWQSLEFDMSSTLIADLESEVHKKRVLVVVGAGVWSALQLVLHSKSAHLGRASSGMG